MAAILQETGRHLYGNVTGMRALIEAFGEKLSRENHLDGSYEVVVTAGSNMAFFEALLAITDPGDEVILLSPYYFNHEMATRIANCTPVVVPTSERFEPNINAIAAAITAKTRAVVTISPNNPTGAVYDEGLLRAVNGLCGERGVYHISDEAYEYFTFDGAAHFSPGAVSGSSAHTISLFSLSKAYGMAGWRLGYMALPANLVPAIRKIQDTNLICAPIPSQIAALGALDIGSAYCRQYLASMAQVRTLVLDALESLGPRVRCAPSRGAIYVFVELDTHLDAIELTTRLIEEYRVAVIPGSTFGARETFVRIAYGALQKETVAAAMERLGHGLSAILGL